MSVTEGDNRFSACRRISVVLKATLAVLAGLVFVWFAFGLRSIVGAFLLNFVPLSWFPSTKRALYVRLPDGYYRLRSWETTPRVYTRLGVRLFQRLMRTRFFGASNLDIPRSFLQRDYEQAEKEMRFAETAHMVVFVFALLLAAYAFARAWWDAVGYLLSWNVFVNLYPVALQRYNRGRLARLVSRRSGGAKPHGD